MSLYRSINGAIWRNIWVVGDLHGCHTLLMNELERVSFDPLCDLLISVGDLIDRGAENVECLELIAMPWFMAVRVADGSLTLTTTKNAWLSRWPIWLQVCHLSSR